MSTQVNYAVQPELSSETVSLSEMTPNTKSTLEFTRQNVESLGDKVRLSDRDEDADLDLFCYVKCNKNDTGLIRDCRGAVFHGDKLVMKAFPYTEEYTLEESEQIEESLSSVSFKDCLFFDSYEGALIRMFYFGEKWYLSTHRKLDAFKCKWSSKESFGTCFKQALEAEFENNEDLRNSLPESDDILDRFQSTLDKDKQYMFLIRNTPKNRIVCLAPERPTVYHVGTFVEGELRVDVNCGIPQPKRLLFKDSESVYSHVADVDIRYIQGVIVFTPDGRQIKIASMDYDELFKARGNEQSIPFRYLQIRMERRTTDMLYYLYPDLIPKFEEYENALYEVAKEIYTSYVNRYIKKMEVKETKNKFVVMKACHNWHHSNRAENRISLNKVIEFMNEQTPSHLNHMIRHYRLEQQKLATDAEEVEEPRRLLTKNE